MKMINGVKQVIGPFDSYEDAVNSKYAKWGGIIMIMLTPQRKKPNE